MTNIQMNAIKQQGMLSELKHHRNGCLWKARQLMDEAHNANSYWDKMEEVEKLVGQSHELQHEIDELELRSRHQLAHR